MELVQYKDAVIARDIQHPALKKVVDYLKTHDVSQDEGKERISYNFLSNMNLEDYVKEEDWQQMSGHSMFDIHFTPGAILLLDPNDAHKTGLKVDQAQDIRKIVFKVRL